MSVSGCTDSTCVCIKSASALTQIVDDLIAANPKQFDELRGGKEKMLGFFVGQVMKATQGKANPQQVNQIIRNRL